MPVLSSILAGIAVAGSVGTGIAGAVEGKQAGDRQQEGLSIQEQIAKQESADKQQAFKQLIDFFTPYLKEGSPFLQMIQRSAAETNATGANNAAGAVRSGVERSGLGYGPSGTEAAALGGVATEAAKTGSQNYLQNLLANEGIKFQAASGIKEAGSMAGSPQNQPAVSAQLPYQSLGSGLSGLSQILKGLLVPGSSGGGGGTQPNSAQNFPIPGVGGSGTPTTEGFIV